MKILEDFVNGTLKTQKGRYTEQSTFAESNLSLAAELNHIVILSKNFDTYQSGICMEAHDCGELENPEHAHT